MFCQAESGDAGGGAASVAVPSTAEAEEPEAAAEGAEEEEIEVDVAVEDVAVDGEEDGADKRLAKPEISLGFRLLACEARQRSGWA